MPDAATVFAIYRFRPDVSDSQIADLLGRHRTALEGGGLVTSTRPTVVRSTHPHPEYRDFIEIFEWSSPEAPAAAHANPAVARVWEEFGTMTTAPTVTLSQLTEASHPWPHFAPFAMTYASDATAKTASPARKSRTAPKAKKTTTPKTTKPTAAVKTTKPKAKTSKRATARVKPKAAPKRAAPKKKRTMSRR